MTAAAEEDLMGGIVRQPWLGGSVLSYPNRPLTILDALDRAVDRFADRRFLVAPEGEVTYREFAELVEGAAERLAEEGIGAGDRLALAARNGLDLAVALWACARLGAILVGLNVRLAPAQWVYMLAHSGASLALAQPEFLVRLQEAATEAGLAPGQVRPVGQHLTGRRRPWSYTDAARPDEASTYAVVYTSGTTGRPKASQVVHRCSMHSGITYSRVLHLTGEDRTAVLFPIYYISAMHAHLLPMMLVGGLCVLVPGATPRNFLALLAAERITWMYAVPSFWLMLLNLEGFAWPNLPDLTVGAFGGSPFPSSAVDTLRRQLPQVRLHDIYGLSETHSPATMLLDEEFRRKPGSVGRPLPCMEARVVDEDDRVLSPGMPGELWLRGSLVTTGYYRDAAATVAAITPEGWLRTGDVARVDAEGYVYILDRKKDMINRGGHKVFSAELEQLLVAHPDVEDAAVVGVPNPLAFETVTAFVVARPGSTLSSNDVCQWVRSQMADYAMPRVVHHVAEIPRNATGKIDKATLRLRAAEPAER
ncbi:MAG TPA: class I adenylate-forming enzyme family protein [Acidimicrobiales bacterium]|nr:class I adenylate-forming enzyme family protein [Acidimicrobiales bacterium]